MARLNLHFLGLFQADLDAVPVEGFDSNKVRALLVYLVMERNRPHSREVLAGMLWPEQSQQSAMDNLRYALADLRRLLGCSTGDGRFLIASRDRIQFDPASDFWLDVAEFERLVGENPGRETDLSTFSIQYLQEAVALYQGSFLEGFTVHRSAPFEEWMLNRRAQLQRSLVSSVAAIADHHERLGDLPAALQAAWKLVELEPWQEETHRQIMRLLAFEGLRSAALAQYETCKNILDSDLGIEPSEETRRLYESVRDGTLYIPPHYQAPVLAGSENELRSIPASFFAREEELQLFNQGLDRVLARENQVIFVTGEAGSGKTALVKEFIRQSLPEHPELVAAYTNCNAFTGASDPYLPFIEIIEMLTGDLDQALLLASGDRSAAARLWSAAPEVIQALISAGPDLVGRLIGGEQLLARARVMPGVPTGRLESLLKQNTSHFTQNLPGSAGKLQTALFEQVLAVFKQVARQRPLLLALDDLQWADADTVNLLFYLCRRLVGSRVMILGIYRQEDLPHAASGKPAPFLSILRELQTGDNCRTIDLAQSNSRKFIQALVDSQPNRLGSDFRRTLERITSGVPLFSIELLGAMQGRGDLVRNAAGEWIETSSLSWDLLPPRVEAAIAEQVARLPAEQQRVLRAASVEGDDFTIEAIARALPLDATDLARQLSGPNARSERMVYATGVQQPSGEGPRLARFRFRHHLFQQYFYLHQDIVERTRMHEAVGLALEALYGEQAGENAITLAHHFELAAMPEKAAAYLLRAGKKAVILLANESAIAHFQKGLELLKAAPPAPARDLLELELQMALGGPLIATRGYTSPVLEQAYTRARRLVEKCGNDSDRFWVLAILKSCYNIQGDPKNSRSIQAQLLKIARRSQDPIMAVTAHHRMVSNCLYYGQWAALHQHLRQFLRLYDPDQVRTFILKLGTDPMPVVLGMTALASWVTGFPDKARRYSQESQRLGHDLAHPIVSWFTNYYAFSFYTYTGEIQAARRCAQAALQICEEQDLAYYRVYSQNFFGWCLAKTQDESGVDLLEQGITSLRTIGDRMNLLVALRLQAEACLETRRCSQALAAIDEALDLTEKTQIIYEKPELMRLKGEILWAQAPDAPQKAAEQFLQASECAAGLQAKLWQLRAETSLARVWLQSSRQKEAYDRLKAVYNWFSEGFNTDELLLAQNLLHALETY